MTHYFSEHYNDLSYPVNSNSGKGLRNSQIGAIHAIASFFTLHQENAAIVVMPTGAGKTAVLMMAPYVLSNDKVLIITPSIMVRSQITNDFQNLATLCKAGVFNEDMEKPVVYELKHKLSPDIIAELEKSDVIIATPNCGLDISESKWGKENIKLVEIDEAHHSPSPTWSKILTNLNQSKKILFTATPFRLDKKEITGDIIYNYPLSRAYRDGIFGNILFVPVKGGENKDLNIAKKAEEVFLSDREEGFLHYLMVRTDTKKNAENLESLYRGNTKLNLERIDSSMSYNTIQKCIAKLKNGELNGVICVDMLGEGFDFPNLKIAAVHVPHKSLASTLQFVGRFARTNSTNIGQAKFIAANDEELKIENFKLYSSDAIWQEMIIGMSEGRNAKEQDDRSFFKSFVDGVSFAHGDVQFSLQNINLNGHDRIYKVRDFDLDSDFPESLNVGNRVFRNDHNLQDSRCLQPSQEDLHRPYQSILSCVSTIRNASCCQMLLLPVLFLRFRS